VKSLMLLWRELAHELASWCCTSTSLDYKKLSDRSKNEGVSFLTITLPTYAKDFERCLEQGKVDPDLFKSFKRRGCLPLFLGGFMDRIFDRGTGVLLNEPDVDSIFAIRQLTLLFAKILLPCSDARERDAMDQFVEIERELEEKSIVDTPELDSEFERIASLLFADVFSSIDRKIYEMDVIPKHGPGSTADKLLGNKKFDQREWTTRLEAIFPSGEFLIANWRYQDVYQQIQFSEPEAERPVRVISVPKTLKTPRIIAIEPTCMQFMQQAILNPLVEELESIRVSRNNRENAVCGFLGFSEQGPNQDLAKLGSHEGTLATLDLSEASDRVSNRHVKLLLRRFPHLNEAVQATRSLKADVPGHGVKTLSKFASMGSALCFPMEAMVFLTAIFLGIQNELGYQLTRKDILSFRGRVRVYGDDIIVPVEYVRLVVESLESFGCKVNTRKSFWNGKFRESCGAEFYDGHDVSIVRVRRMMPKRRADVEEVISLVSLRNQLYNAGLWQTTRWLDNNHIKRVMRKHGKLYFPVVEATSPVLGRHSVFPYTSEKLDADTHAPRVQGFVESSRPPRSIASGEGALVKCLLKQGFEPFADRRHLERQGRPRAVDIKLRWMAPF
jgi:hypothetical protein